MSNFKYIEKDGKVYMIIGDYRIEIPWQARWVPNWEEIQPGPGPGPEPTSYTVTYTAMDSNITFSSDQAEVEANDPLELYIVPNEGYRIKTGPSVIIMMGGVNIAMSAFNTTTGRIYIEHVTGDVRITAINVAEPDTPQPTTWDVDTSGIWGGYLVESGSGQPAVVPSEVENNAPFGPYYLESNYSDYTVDHAYVYMGGVDITATAYDPSNDGIYIEHVTGDITFDIQLDEVPDEPIEEDIPVESIEFTNLPEDHSIELNVGDVVDMSQYIEVSPSDATDSSYTLSTDAPSVISINGTTITVLQGTEGLNANLTVTANDGSGCSDTMVVQILNGDDEPDDPEEEEIPIESLRYTDGDGTTCVGFGMLEGQSVDLYENLEILPEGATDGVEFASSDDAVIEVDGGGVATAVGTAGESATITMRSMGDPNISTTVEISISIEDDEPDEEEPEE